MGLVDKVKIYKLIGPPGTGKTYRTLADIERAAKRYSPERIGAISYTNAAINEMKDRIINVNHGIGREILKNIRTLHSQCFKLLDLEKEQVAEKHISEFNEDYPDYAISCSDIRSEHDINTVSKLDINNNRFREMQILRNRRVPIEKWSAGVKLFWGAWSKWLNETGYFDYTKMLEETLLIGRYPAIDVLFVDEAQDLTRLQMELVLKWANIVDVTTLVGDADQAIFRFAGAEPEVFRDIKANWFDSLKQSYRVPKKILDYSLTHIRRIKDREDIEYKPKVGIDGEICTACVEPDLKRPGSHMIITRCMYQIMQYIQWLKRKKMLWHNPYRPDELLFNPEKTSEFRAVKTYSKIASGGEVTQGEAIDMVEHLVAQENVIRGQKKAILEKERTNKIVDFFSLMNWGFTESFLQFKKPLEELFKLKTDSGKYAIELAKCGKLDQKPVIAGTIHSVKGGEADNVWVSLRRAQKIVDEMSRSSVAVDDETRIAYVAFTRAKNFLGILR